MLVDGLVQLANFEALGMAQDIDLIRVGESPRWCNITWTAYFKPTSARFRKKRGLFLFIGWVTNGCQITLKTVFDLQMVRLAFQKLS